MANCVCIYCGNDFQEEKSNAVESTVYCSSICERDDDFEKNQDEF